MLRKCMCSRDFQLPAHAFSPLCIVFWHDMPANINMVMVLVAGFSAKGHACVIVRLSLSSRTIFSGLFAGHDPTRGLGRRGVQNVTGRAGSGRVGSIVLQISRVGSGRVKNFSNLGGRVRSGQEVMKAHGSGQVMTREKRVTRGSDPHDPRVAFC